MSTQTVLRSVLSHLRYESECPSQFHSRSNPGVDSRNDRARPSTAFGQGHHHPDSRDGRQGTTNHSESRGVRVQERRGECRAEKRRRSGRPLRRTDWTTLSRNILHWALGQFLTTGSISVGASVNAHSVGGAPLSRPRRVLRRRCGRH